MGTAKTLADDLMKQFFQLLMPRFHSHRLRGLRIGKIALPILCMAITWNTALWAAPADTERASYSVIITSLPGEKEYEKVIQGWGKDLTAVLKKNAVSEDHVYWLAPSKDAGVYAVATRDEIMKLMNALANKVVPADSFQLFLLGHGTYDDFDFRFNIPGPDITATDIANMLGKIRAERQVVINLASASGASLKPLQRKSRVVVTSTSVGRERNFTQFARYFIAALQDKSADADKNQQISVLEAFRFASREVARYYESKTRLATEHAMIEDRGEGEGVRDPGPDNGEGLVAASAVLVRFGSESASVDTPETRELRANKRKIEEGIEALKFSKPSMKSEEYSEQLEKLLIDLAKAQQQIDNLEKK